MLGDQLLESSLVHSNPDCRRFLLITNHLGQRERTGDQPQRAGSNLRPYTGGFSNPYSNPSRDPRNPGGQRDSRNDRGRNDRGRNDNAPFRNRGNDRNDGRGRRR